MLLSQYVEECEVNEPAEGLDEVSELISIFDQVLLSKRMEKLWKKGKE